eukprot:XP_011455438.1 PREDICTED: hillarin-like isoform X2 [Crassostrea gigas]
MVVCSTYSQSKVVLFRSSRISRGHTQHDAKRRDVICHVLCHALAVDIPCVIIHGIAKSVIYEVGETNTDGLTNSWNAVFVGGSWRLIFPLWACRSVVGHSTGKWILIEPTDIGKLEPEKTTGGAVIQQLNEFFFLTDPDVFQYHCFPNDPLWQLVPKVISLEKFLSLPFLRQDFFENKLKLMSTSSCRLEATRGECDVVIKTLDNLSLKFSNELQFSSKDLDSKPPSQGQPQNCVAMVHQDKKVSFSVRCPTEGVYKLKIYGGREGDKRWLYSSCIVCAEVSDHIIPYPTAPDIGFGPQKLTEEAGLIAMSHKSGCVQVHRNKTCEISFTLTKFVLVHSTLHRFDVSSNSLAQYVSQRIQNDNLRIDVTPPQDGEYTLHINCKEKGSKNGFMNVCNYLLNTDVKNTRSWENAREKVARQDLRAKTLSVTTKNAKELQNAIEKANQLCLEDKGDLKFAHERLDLLQMQKALDDGINRRNVDILEPAIKAAKISDQVYKLSDRIKEAEELRDHLLTLKRFAHDVLDMKQTTISEIHRYSIPSSLIFNVMKATFLLLGEHPQNLEIWEDLQVLMRQTGRQSLLYKVRKFDTLGTDRELATRVLHILEPYTVEQVSSASAGAGTFYNWAKNIATEVNGRKQGKAKPSKTKKK